MTDDYDFMQNSEHVEDPAPVSPVADEPAVRAEFAALHSRLRRLDARVKMLSHSPAALCDWVSREVADIIQDFS